jgi:protein-S-isoprenylcysteine O-methyltransferase Ste14
MARAIYLLFGVVAYLIFFLTFLYLIAFVGDLSFAPRTVDRGGPSADLGLALAIDIGLIALFGLQHSVMARKGFKAAWTRIVPEPIERSTYVLFASAALIVMMYFWRPIDGTLWEITNPTGIAAMTILFFVGWVVVLISTFLINHFELFGLRQVWSHARGQAIPPPVFREPFFYRRIRHPLYAGFVLAFWAAPDMTIGHFVLSAGMTVYILIAIYYEERDLVGLFGPEYEAYQQRAGMLLPKLRRPAQ